MPGNHLGAHSLRGSGAAPASPQALQSAASVAVTWGSERDPERRARGQACRARLRALQTPPPGRAASEPAAQEERAVRVGSGRRARFSTFRCPPLRSPRPAGRGRRAAGRGTRADAGWRRAIFKPWGVAGLVGVRPPPRRSRTRVRASCGAWQAMRPRAPAPLTGRRRDAAEAAAALAPLNCPWSVTCDPDRGHCLMFYKLIQPQCV